LLVLRDVRSASELAAESDRSWCGDHWRAPRHVGVLAGRCV